MSTTFTNSFLVSQKNSEFWLKCIEQMKQSLPWYKKIGRQMNVMNSTGPLMLNKVANKYSNYITTLNKIVVDCDVCNIKNCKIDTSYYITPIEGQSWTSWDSVLINKFYCNRKIIFLIILIIIIYKIK